MATDGHRPNSETGEQPIVVIGGGIAGQTLCEILRERDPNVAIVLVCAEQDPPYDRVNLAELLVGDDGLDALRLRPPEWYEDSGVELRLGSRVESLDTVQRRMELEDGSTISYRGLALATGSQPLMPPIPGIDIGGVLPYRYPSDTSAIAEAAESAEHAAVIGGGLLGLEAARGIQARACPVTVVHLMDRLMERQLDASAAGLLAPAMEELGINVQLERQTEEIFGNGRVEGLRFAGGDELRAELVVVSVGIRPEVTLADQAGIDCNRGVIVDDRMRTSEDGIVAVGECAEHRGTVYGIVAPIYEQVKVAADTLLDREGEDYRGSVPWTKLKVAEVDLVAVGNVQGDGGASTLDPATRTYRKLATQDGRACGAILLGNTRGTEGLLEAVRAGEAIEDPLARLAESAEAGPEDLPDATQVCDCNGVCKGDIVAAVRDDGLTTKQEVMAVTRAGTGCGSCKPLVAELVQVAGGGSEASTYLCPCRKQTREQLAGEISEHGYEAVSEVSEACGTGRECGLCKPALAYLVSEINDNRHREERGARHINDRVHANIQNDGTFSVVPRMRGGVTTPDQLRRIADAAERYDVGMVKVTGAQRIDLLGVKKEDLPAVWRDIGMPSGHAYAKALRHVKSCVGTDFCRFGIGDSTALAIEMEERWEGLHTPAKVKCGVSGCPRNCAEATVKDIGVVAVEGGWQVVVGGAAGATVRKADVLTTAETAEEALEAATAFLQYYREHGEYKERTYDFVPRIGLERVRDEVLDETSGARLRERFRIAKAAAAARDPWLERDAPYHPSQFRELPMVGDNGAARPADNGGQESMLVGPPEGAQR
jgi:nitrite reductase (NADH) large subunit